MRVGLYTSLRIPGACTKIVRCLHIALVMERDWVREFVISGRTTRILNTVTVFLTEKRVEHDKEEPTAKEICDFKRKIDNWRRVFNRNNKPKIPAPINVQPLVNRLKARLEKKRSNAVSECAREDKDQNEEQPVRVESNGEHSS